VISRYSVNNRDLSDEDYLIMKVLRLYYERHFNQAEVAKRMGFSRPKVSRLISEGHSRGFVKIEIASPTGDFAPLEIALEDRYGIGEVRISATAEEGRSTELAVGGLTAACLARVCGSGSTLGVSWGTTVRALVEAVPRLAFKCDRVVPLVGSIGRAETVLHSNRACLNLAAKLGVEALNLDAPAIARSASSRDELMETPGIEDTLKAAVSCDVAVVGIGGILPTSTIIYAGFFDSEEFLGLAERGAVGDVCFHFLDSFGNPCLPEVSERVVGITLEQIRDVPEVIGIATGAEKAAGVAAVLAGGYVNRLVCDQSLAQALLEI
jgi:DNA-binding transcriptional regulator LsrR (DeoR family)